MRDLLPILIPSAKPLTRPGGKAPRGLSLQEPTEDEPEEETPVTVVEHLVGMEVDELQAFAEEHGVDISGLEEKADLVDAISIHPGVARILREAGANVDEAPLAEEQAAEAAAEAEKEAEEEGDAQEPPEEPPEAEAEEEPEPEEAPKPEPEAPDLKGRLQAAMRTRLDFPALQQHLAEAVSRFKEGNYDAVARTAHEAVLQMDETARRFVEASWAFALASTARMLEEMPESSDMGAEAEARLKEARQAFEDDSFLQSSDLLEGLAATAEDLHANLMAAARDHVKAQEEVLEAVKAMGGDTTKAHAMLGKAMQALEANQRAAYLDLVKEADRLVASAREGRIEELQEKTEAVGTLVEEAATIGGDVGRASSLLEDARQAFDTGEFATGHDLLEKAERAALDAQKAQIDRVAAMQEQQLQRVKTLIAEIKPTIDQARGEGFHAKEALSDLKAAVEHANGGDYVNAMMKAKRAYRAVKAFHSELEAKRIEEGTPVPAETPDQPAPPPSPAEQPAPSEPTPEAESDDEPPRDAPSGAPPAETICIYCGSANLSIKKNGKVKCLECKRKFRL